MPAGAPTSDGLQRARSFRLVAPRGLLHRPHPGVMAVLGQQCRVRASLDDAASVDNQDLVGIDDCREAMRDHHARLLPPWPPSERSELCEDLGLCERVNGGGRLVAEEDGRIAEQRAADGDALLLPARELQATLAHDGVVPAETKAKGASRRHAVCQGGVGAGEGEGMRTRAACP
jgi:hypothetical protein